MLLNEFSHLDYRGFGDRSIDHPYFIRLIWIRTVGYVANL